MNCIIFILGLIIGSFINVCVYRIPREESISYPPSTCTTCGSRIKIYDLIPVVSYIMLKGRCRKCKEKISIRYPITELLTGILFLFIYLKFGNSYDTIKNIVLVVFVEIIAIIDFDTMEVYSSITYTAMAIGVLNIIIEKIVFHMHILTYLLGAAIPAAFIYIINKFSKGFGGGDIDVFIIIGLFLGANLSGLTLFFSIIIGAASAIILVISKKLSKKDAMPFVPYIFAAMLITLLWGEEIIDYYLKMIV